MFPLVKIYFNLQTINIIAFAIQYCVILIFDHKRLSTLLSKLSHNCLWKLCIPYPMCQLINRLSLRHMALNVLCNTLNFVHKPPTYTSES